MYTRAVKTIVLVGCVISVIGLGAYAYYVHTHKRNVIKVGILHSQTGPLALNELPLIDAALFAIEDINSHGGVLGSRLEPIVVDGKSDEKEFAACAEQLITRDHVAVIFGCFASSTRKAVKPIVEQYHSLLFYSTQYEGLEESSHIVYMGGTPNQGVVPGVSWCYKNLGKKFFFVGTDSVFSHVIHEIIAHHIEHIGGQLVGEEYISLGSDEVDPVIATIKATHPEVLISAIDGTTNKSFFTQLRAAGFTTEKLPTLSLTIQESMLQALGAELMVGDYTVSGYFQTISRVENDSFVASFKKRYGANRMIDGPMERTYSSVKLWAKAVEDAQTTDVKELVPCIRLQHLNVPSRIIYLDQNSQHIWERILIGKFQYNGQCDVVWDSKKSVSPLVYSSAKTKAEWETFLNTLYKGWGNQWTKPVH